MPSTSVVRTGTGAVAADNAVINTTNYPFALGFNPDCRVGKILVNWSASGTVGVNDWLDLQVLLWDGLASTPGWAEGETQYGVRPNQAVEFDVAGASMVCVRVVRVSCPSGTGLIVRAAQSDSLG